MKTPASTRTTTILTAKGKTRGTARRASTLPVQVRATKSRTTSKRPQYGLDEQGQVRAFIRSCIHTLETAADLEALSLICAYGVFAINDPSQITDAACRLWSGRSAHQVKASRIDAQIDAAGMTDAQRALVGESQDLDTEEQCELVDAAYLLGIAVGRRLGPLGLATIRDARGRR